MNPELRLFTRQLLALATITGLLIIGLAMLIPPRLISPSLPYLLIFFTAATLLSFLFLQKRMKASPTGFVTAFMANSIIRLLLYLVIIVVYALLNRADAVNFIIAFFVYYLIFTIFEVVYILRKQK